MLRTLTVPVLLLLATACQSPVPSPAPVARRSEAPVAPAAAPGPLTCRLPIQSLPDGANGFLDFPGATFEPVTTPPATIPEIKGYYTQTYDWTFARWLPVGPAQISPDGARYAYQNDNRVLKVVDVVSGAVTPIPGGAGWNLIAMADDGVYVHTYVGPAGLWFLHLAGGPPVQVSPAGFSYLALGGGYAYAIAGKDDPTLLRVDLQTGSAVRFADAPASVLGFDRSGSPLLGLPEALVLMESPYTPIPVVDRFPLGFVLGDANGVWFSLADGTYLRTPDGKVSRMSDRPSLIQGPCR